jgi:DNA mismatch endonuclease (patch repair protein)
MSDCYDSDTRSMVMSRIRSYGTTPELKVQELLERWLPGEEVVVHPEGLLGHPDFYVPGLNLVIFVDGCFFHKCRQHYVEPVQNSEYWSAKIKRNVRRDKKVRHELRAQGYIVMRIWEHDVRGKKMPGKDLIRRRIRRLQKQHG